MIAAEVIAAARPKWLAYLIQWMDDAGSDAAWPGVVKRVGALAPRFGRLRGVVSTRLRSRVLAIIVRDAVRSAGTEHESVARVLALLDRHGEGKSGTRSNRIAAGDAARETAAADAALAAWSDAAWACGSAAREAARAANKSVPRAADRITTAILDEIERTLDAMEMGK